MKIWVGKNDNLWTNSLNSRNCCLYWTRLYLNLTNFCLNITSKDWQVDTDITIMASTNTSYLRANIPICCTSLYDVCIFWLNQICAPAWSTSLHLPQPHLWHRWTSIHLPQPHLWHRWTSLHLPQPHFWQWWTKQHLPQPHSCTD